MNHKKINQAKQILKTEGKKYFCPTAKPTGGECIGAALFHTTDPATILDIAITSLEQWNYHLAVAALIAIKENKFKKIGKTLTVTLPEYW